MKLYYYAGRRGFAEKIRVLLAETGIVRIALRKPMLLSILYFILLEQQKVNDSDKNEQAKSQEKLLAKEKNKTKQASQI